jgi:hypothetical protein
MNVLEIAEVRNFNHEAVTVDFESELSWNVGETDFGGFRVHDGFRMLKGLANCYTMAYVNGMNGGNGRIDAQELWTHIRRRQYGELVQTVIVA